MTPRTPPSPLNLRIVRPFFQRLRSISMKNTRTSSIYSIGCIVPAFAVICKPSQRVVRRKAKYQILLDNPFVHGFVPTLFVLFCSNQGVVQRSYNAFAVRVQDSVPPAPGRGVEGAGGTGAGTRTIIPAGKTTEGTLCIELRIRLHQDGTMSKLLENLANVRPSFLCTDVPTWYNICWTHSTVDVDLYWLVSSRGELCTSSRAQLR